MGWDGLLALMKDNPRRAVTLRTFFVEHRTRLRGTPGAARDWCPHPVLAPINHGVGFEDVFRDFTGAIQMHQRVVPAQVAFVT